MQIGDIVPDPTDASLDVEVLDIDEAGLVTARRPDGTTVCTGMPAYVWVQLKRDGKVGGDAGA